MHGPFFFQFNCDFIWNLDATCLRCPIEIGQLSFFEF